MIGRKVAVVTGSYWRSLNNVRDKGKHWNRSYIDDKARRVNFLLCPSCFWCASCFSSKIISTMSSAEDSSSVAKCPFCIKGNVESIPIADDEEYKFDYDVKRGVTMRFFR
jgi:hypothetical protein